MPKAEAPAELFEVGADIEPPGPTATEAMCSVPGCLKQKRSKGMCRAHGYRQRLYGSPDKTTMHGEPLAARLFAKVLVLPSGCWVFQPAVKDDWYGKIRDDGKTSNVHTVVWTWLRGPVPDGLELDHLCRYRPCCNPDHLDAVTHRENCFRGLAPVFAKLRRVTQTHCKRGHEFNSVNTNFTTKQRVCTICKRDRNRRARHAQS